MMETSAAYCWGILVPLTKRIPSESPSTTKMEYKQRNFPVADALLLKENIGRNKWSMAQIVSTEHDSQGIV